jgi:hypothetical protein
MLLSPSCTRNPAAPLVDVEVEVEVVEVDVVGVEVARVDFTPALLVVELLVVELLPQLVSKTVATAKSTDRQIVFASIPLLFWARLNIILIPNAKVQQKLAEQKRTVHSNLRWRGLRPPVASLIAAVVKDMLSHRTVAA